MKEIATNIFYIAKMFFGILTIFTFLTATTYREEIVFSSLALFIITAIIYKLLNR